MILFKKMLKIRGFLNEVAYPCMLSSAAMWAYFGLLMIDLTIKPNSLHYFACLMFWNEVRWLMRFGVCFEQSCLNQLLLWGSLLGLYRNYMNLIMVRTTFCCQSNWENILITEHPRIIRAYNKLDGFYRMMCTIKRKWQWLLKHSEKLAIALV